MMRSLYSGVAGLKTHQTRMDVIGNNVANVNTVAYKSMSMTFTELMYQTTQSASGPDATTGVAGRNAKQIGLGSTTGAINTQITTQGSTQTTGNPFDLRISGNSFFIVSDGGNTGSKYFTRDGSFYVDAIGNLAMTSNGYNVMGWQVDKTTGDIRQDTVTALKVMDANNLTYEPEATTKGYISGILDKNDTNVHSTQGRAMSLGFYDDLGYQYTAKLSVHATTDNATYYVVLDDVINSDGKSLTEVYGNVPLSDIVSLGGVDSTQTVAVNEAYASKNEFSIDSSIQVATPLTTLNTLELEKSLVDVQAAVEAYFSKDAGVEANKILTQDQTDLLTKVYGTTVLDQLKLYRDTYKDAYDKGFVNFTVSTSTQSLGNINLEVGKINSEPTFSTEQLQEMWTMVNPPQGTTPKTADQIYLPDTPGAAEAQRIGATQTQVADDKQKLITAGYLAADASDKDYAAYKLQQLYPNVDFSKVNAGKIDDSGNFVVTSKDVDGGLLKYNAETGEFSSIQTNGSDPKNASLIFKKNINVDGKQVTLQNFKTIQIDFSPSTMYNNGGTSTIGLNRGDTDGAGAGRMLGKMEGISIQTDGRIYATYTNGCKRLLGQIAVAQFANASGLEKAGDNLYQATMNSGDFDGIGVNIAADGGSMTSGTLEMSNVDLANEFTEMITTQCGYQANSRIITVSDTLLEELVNLKR